MKGLGEIFSTTVNKTYIPLTTLSFSVERNLWGNNLFVYHLDNLLLHLGVTALLFVLAGQLGLSIGARTIAALIFGLHPMHVESVAWLTERKDVLYSFFYLLAVIFYWQHLKISSGETIARHPSPRLFFPAAVFCGVLSALAKPMALSLPLIFFLLDWYRRRKFTLRLLAEKVWAALFIFPVIMVSYLNFARAVDLQPFRALLVWIWCFIFYLRKFFFPADFYMFYSLPAPLSLKNPGYFVPILAFILILVGVIRWRKHRLVLFSFAWYFFSIFFLLRYDYLRDADIVADRFMYLPSLGFCLLLGVALEKAWQGARTRQTKIVVGFLALASLIYLSAQTFQQIAVWQDGLSFWGYQLKRHEKGPDKIIWSLFYDKYGEALMARPAWQMAVARYKKCRAEQKEKVSCLSKEMAAERDQLIGYFTQAIAIRPRYAQPHYHLGQIYSIFGESNKAQAYFEKTVALAPTHYAASWELGRIYHQQKEYRAAVDAFRRAMVASPGNHLLEQDIANFYAERSRNCECAPLYQYERQKMLNSPLKR